MIPKDPIMLLSFVNTKLRDDYDSLGEFCDFFGVSEDDIIARLEAVNYKYDESLNQFK